MAATRASQAVQSWLHKRTQQELADLIGARIGRNVCQSTISAIKRGTATPRGDIMSALYAELHVEIDWWSEIVDAPLPPESGTDLSAAETGEYRASSAKTG